MKFSELITIRQSVRNYSGKPIEKEKIGLLIESVRLAPSASNSQPWKLIIVDDPKLKNKVANATFTKAVSFNKFTLQAPALAVLVIEKPKLITQVGGNIKDRDFPLIDIGIAAAHFCLQAVDLGLGTCMIGWFDEPQVRKLLNIPSAKRIGLIISLGYAADVSDIRKKKRKDQSEMSGFNSYD